MLDKASAVIETFRACDLSEIPITDQEDDPIIRKAIHQKGGRIPEFKAALEEWANTYAPTVSSEPWMAMMPSVERYHRIADAIATVTVHHDEKHPVTYSELRLARAKQTIETELDYTVRQRGVVDLSQGTIGLKTEAPNVADILAQLIGATLFTKGKILRCARCDKLFVRPNPRAIYCHVNCRSGEYQRAKRAAP